MYLGIKNWCQLFSARRHFDFHKTKELTVYVVIVQTKAHPAKFKMSWKVSNDVLNKSNTQELLVYPSQVLNFLVSTVVRPQYAPWEKDSTWTWQKSSWIRLSMSWWKQACTRSPQNFTTVSNISLMAFYSKRCSWKTRWPVSREETLNDKAISVSS